MKAKLNTQYRWIAILLLLLFVLQATNLWAQEKTSPQKDATVRIRIEKMENGKRKVLEKTYKPGEVPANFDSEEGWKEMSTDEPLFLGKDFLMRFDSTFNDEKFRKPAHAFHFNDSDSVFNRLFVFKTQDSLFSGMHKRVYPFINTPFTKDQLDSLRGKNRSEHQAFIMKFQGDHFIQLDSLMKKHELMKDFLVEFTHPQVWKSETDMQEEYIFDKKEYSLQEIEDKQGNKKIVVTRKKNKDTLEKKSNKKEKK